MIEFLKQLTNPESILHYGGLLSLLCVVFAETGLLVGFFLPGDNLILLSGMMCASKPELLGVNLPILILLLSFSAITGNTAGYWFGYRVGPKLFERKDSLIFKKKYLEITDAYYKKRGGATLIFGRFLPVVRTFAPILAGVIKIKFSTFMLYNIIGALVWIGTLTSLGFYFGTYEWVQNNVKYIALALIFITMIPIILAWRNQKREKV